MNSTKNIRTPTATWLHKVDYDSWPIDWLANYIEKLQRKNILEKSKSIRRNLNLVKNNFYPPDKYLLQLETLFTAAIDRMYAHMQKEEQYLFPFVKEMVYAKELKSTINRTALHKMEWLINNLNEEHAVERIQLKLRADVSNNYATISNVSKAQNNLWLELNEFENACKLHIDLQYYFLFPKIIAAKYG